MATRATPADVRAINGSTADDATIQPLIDTANVIVNSVLLCANTDEGTLTQAETWLACHLMAVSGVGQANGGAAVKTSEKFDLYSVTWAVSAGTGSGVLSTNYGQTANMLLGGCLESKDKRSAGIAFGGGA